MNDMVKVTEPKSDQWNYDDFLGGAMTFKIAAVKVKGGQEQPVEITLAGTPKFYRPCKSMSRVLVAAWGPDSSKYPGRSLTLYGDPKVKWAGMEVGGIRISHLSNISDEMTMALTATRGSRKAFTVRPMKAAVDTNTGEIDAEELLNSAASLEALGAAWKSLSKADRECLVTVKDKRKAELEAAIAARAPKPSDDDEPPNLLSDEAPL